jgi:transposase
LDKQKVRKRKSLKQAGCLNPSPDTVKDVLFVESDFFDPDDLVQVKYEMVRKVKVDGKPINETATQFGFSRPSFYQAQARMEEGGIQALVPKKPGPRRSHKLDEKVINFLEELLSKNARISTSQLADQVLERFDLQVHPRSIERSLQKQKKKRP